MESFETIHERIAFLVKEFGKGKNTVFASLVGSNEGNIRGYINKGVMPKQDVLERMVRSLGINAAWLLTGEGAMMPEENRWFGGRGENLVSIPIVDIGAAAGVEGFDNPTQLNVEDTIAMPCHMVSKQHRYFCIRVRGESMSPTMLDSGYLVVRLLDASEWQDIVNNQVYVISVRDGGAYVKRIKNRLREKGFVVCSSDNPDKEAYPNFNVYETELQSIFRAEWYFTARIPNIHETYYKKVEDLEKKYEDLQDQFDELKSRIEERK